MKAAAVFEWQGKDSRGSSRKGEISAQNLSEARTMLRKQGISVKKVKKQQKSILSRGQKIVPADISVVSRQIATMLAAGVTLIQSLEMIGQGHSKAPMRSLLMEITSEVKSGNPLSSALRKHPQHFDSLYCDLVYTGEQSGALEVIYERIATYKEKAEALKSKIKKAMFYPIAVLVVAFIVTTILLVFVVPQFEERLGGVNYPLFRCMLRKTSIILYSLSKSGSCSELPEL